MRDTLMAVFCVVCWFVAIEAVKNREGYLIVKATETKAHTVDKETWECLKLNEKGDCKKSINPIKM